MTSASPLSASVRCLIALGFVCISLLSTGCATTEASSGGEAIAGEAVAYTTGWQASPQQDVRAQQLMVKGMTRAYLGDHDEAIALYEEALQLVPSEATLFSALAASHRALDELTSAVFYAQRAIVLAPDNVYHHHHLAELHLEAGDAEQAADAYDALLTRFPQDEAALLASAELFSRLGYTDRAAQRYERLLDVVGDDPVLLENVLQLYLRQGDDARAESTLQALIEQEVDDPALRQMLGELYLRQGRQEEATAAFERAIESGGGEETVLALSDLYRQQGDAAKADALLDASVAPSNEAAAPDVLLEKARPLARRAEADPEAAAAATRLVERALDQDPANAEALALLGTLRAQAGDYERAGALFDDALAQDPRDPALWQRAAEAHFRSGNAQRAADVADEATLLFPGHPSLLQTSGQALAALHRNEEALAALEEALALLEEAEEENEVDQALLFGALSLLYARQAETSEVCFFKDRQCDEAETSDAYYQQGRSYEAPSAMALHYLALSLAARGGDQEEARRLAQQAVDLDPSNPLFMDTLGWVYLQLGDLEKAEQWIGQALQQDAAPASAAEHYGDLQARLGDREAARPFWEQALEQMPDNKPLQAKLQAAQ